ncbi:winged helix-turn-helix domain-containing protein [Halosegnis longus]
MSDRTPAEWMCTLDERIIEYVAEDSLASPRLMASAMQFNATRRRIRERCQMLTDAGLIAPISDDAQMYEVTREGQRYLEGDLDAEHQPRPRARG